MICSSPLFFSSLWFSCPLVHSLVCRSVGCYSCGLKGRVCRGLTLTELALVFASLSPFLCFQPGPLEFISGFLDALSQCFCPRVDSFNTCSRRRLQVYDPSRCNAALVAIPAYILVSFHDQLDLPTFLMESRPLDSFESFPFACPVRSLAQSGYAAVHIRSWFVAPIGAQFSPVSVCDKCS